MKIGFNQIKTLFCTIALIAPFHFICHKEHRNIIISSESFGHATLPYMFKKEGIIALVMSGLFYLRSSSI